VIAARLPSVQRRSCETRDQASSTAFVGDPSERNHAARSSSGIRTQRPIRRARRLLPFLIFLSEGPADTAAWVAIAWRQRWVRTPHANPDSTTDTGLARVAVSGAEHQRRQYPRLARRKVEAGASQGRRNCVRIPIHLLRRDRRGRPAPTRCPRLARRRWLRSSSHLKKRPSRYWFRKWPSPTGHGFHRKQDPCVDIPESSRARSERGGRRFQARPSGLGRLLPTGRLVGQVRRHRPLCPRAGGNTGQQQTQPPRTRLDGPLHVQLVGESRDLSTHRDSALPDCACAEMNDVGSRVRRRPCTL